MTFQVTVSNEVERRAARRILRGRGLPTSEVHRMSYATLAAQLQGQCDEPTWQAAVQHALASTADAKLAKDAPPPSGPSEGPSSEPTDPRKADMVREAMNRVLKAAQAAAQAQGKAKGEGTGEGQGEGEGGKPDALEARVREIVAEMQAEKPAEMPAPSLDAEAVREIAEAVVKAETLPTRVTVVMPDLSERTIEGTTHYRMPLILKALAARCHVWLPGPAGSGKSTAARQALESIGYSEPIPGEPAETGKRIHMSGAIETPFQLTGYRSPTNDPATLMTPFRKAWQYGGAFIFDDVDRSNPKALAAFNEALANGHCAFPDGVCKAHADFLCIATANTFGLGGGTDYVGAARLDKATLDRFVYIEIPYDEAQERAIAGKDGQEWCRFVQKARKACKALGLKHLVTPRATYKGLALLAAGMSRADVETATAFAGLDAETLGRVKAGL